MGLQFGPGVDFKELSKAVSEHSTVENSAITLLNGIADNIAVAIQRADANTQFQLNELVAELEKQTKALTDAVVTHRPLAATTLDDTTPVVANTIADNPMLSAPTPSIPDAVLHPPTHTIDVPVANTDPVVVLGPVPGDENPIANNDPVFVEPTPPGDIVVPEPEPISVVEPVSPIGETPVISEPVVEPVANTEPSVVAVAPDPVVANVETIAVGNTEPTSNTMIDIPPQGETVDVANTDPVNTLKNPPVFFNQLVHENITNDLIQKGLIA